MTSIQSSDGNVTVLKQYRPPMKNPILVELMTHWENLRAGRIAPQRSEIDPRQIENALQYAFILERMDKTDIRFRIAGMQLCQMMGMEIRAMPAHSIVAESSRAEFSNILNRVFDRPEIVELTLHATQFLRTQHKADMLLLPMNNEDGETTRILGVLVSNADGNKVPQRFEIAGKKITRIVAVKTAMTDKLVSGFAEAPAYFRPQNQPHAHAPDENSRQNTGQNTGQKPYLRLVKSDR